jgi:ATP-binding cassette subfamily B protein
MFLISRGLALIILIQMGILVIIILIVMPRLRPYYRRIQESRSNINNHAWQMIFGINTIKLNTMEETQKQSFGKLSLNYLKANMKLQLFEAVTWPFFLFFFSLSQCVILFYGGKEIINGEIKIEELLQFSVMIGVMIFPIFSLGWVMSILQQGISAWDRISKILNEPEDLNKTNILPNKPLNIVCKNIGLELEKGKNLLKRISFEITPGEMIGIAGNIGSGKTILLEVLAGIKPVTSGKVFIGGIDINTIERNSLYKKLSFASQEAFLFSTTIKKNIGFQGGFDPIQKKVEKSAYISDVAYDIMNFPDRYMQILGERGINLSGGQKQRTSLARAIYKEAEILIIDDSLSAVDAKTEMNIVDNIKKLKKLKTIIIVSHRISVLKHVDKIFFLNNGEIVEKGTHKQLIHKKNGYYAKLVELQKLKENLT